MYVVPKKGGLSMKINYNVNSKERKALVDKISEITKTPAKYLGVPSCAYQVGHFTIGRNGELSFNDQANIGEVELLIERLSEAGFEAEIQIEETNLVIQMPRTYFTDTGLENLEKLIKAKGSLIKKALNVDFLSIEKDEERISFPWFQGMPDAEEIKAYTIFITKLCEMANKQQRITATEKPVENEKYAFRCFLLRLGFIGSEFKNERKILLSRLTGSSAFRTGVTDEVADNE